LKSIFGIERPYAYLSYVHTYKDGAWTLNNDLIGDVSANDSFPSGHASMTFPVLGALWAYRKIRLLLSIILFIIMFLIVYVGQHYVSDIIAGALIGFLAGHLAWKITKSVWQKRYVFG
jgi:membrane-associated phospholipid phosphatase